jgi:hypothetical protein
LSLHLNVTNGSDDLITSKLPPQAYQLTLTVAPPAGALTRSLLLAACSSSMRRARAPVAIPGPHHRANARMHAVSEVVSEPEPKDATSYASRSATKQYRTAPLHGLWQHAPYFHNGSAATLAAVVETYNSRKSLGLTEAQRADLTQYLKSL